MTADVPLVSEQELVAHIFAPVKGPVWPQAHDRIRQLWSRCRDRLGMTEVIRRVGLPRQLPDDLAATPAGAIACQQSPDGHFQAILRREHDVLNLSLALAPGKGPDDSEPSWAGLDERLDSVAGDQTETLIGTARLYLAKVAAADGLVSGSAQLGSGLAALLPAVPQGTGWWQRGLTGPAGLATWEVSPREDARVERRIVVVAPADRDQELSAWTWSRGDPPMPPFARYLMHMAKIRYELRVHAGSLPVEAQCERIDDSVAALRALVETAGPDRLGEVAERLAELRADRARMIEKAAALKAMKHTVQIAEQNAAAALGPAAGDVTGNDLVGDDRDMARFLGKQLDNDLVYLDASLGSAAQMSEIAAEIVPASRGPGSAIRGPSPSPVPVFGIITALPEEFAAMRALIDGPERVNIPGDRADYVLGTAPSLDPARPHRVVVSLLGATGNSAAAESCANLIRSFESVSCVLMVGIAAGIPAPRRPEQHVRLGDIVVATAGIVDYDHIDDKAGGPVLREPFPQPSPLLVRRARWLQAEEKSGIRPWEQWIQRGESALPGFARPPADTDLVYASDQATRPAQHPDMTLSGHRAGWPKVHYGPIGSADRSLRNARRRDQLTGRHGLRAIEMEGAGIGKASFAGGLEWLVVRGISDYGDRRVTRRWRNYACLVAAAYTRALLAECPPVAARGGHSDAVPAR
jgi:nucleoside phosphorylase